MHGAGLAGCLLLALFTLAAGAIEGGINDSSAHLRGTRSGTRSLLVPHGRYYSTGQRVKVS